jgi:hypothetical protein
MYEVHEIILELKPKVQVAINVEDLELRISVEIVQSD